MGKFVHVAVFTWKSDVTEAQRRAVSDALATLPELLPDLRAYRFGADAGLSTGNDDFALIAEFDDADGYARYASDPRHLDIIQRVVRPITESRHAVQLQTG